MTIGLGPTGGLEDSLVELGKRETEELRREDDERLLREAEEKGDLRGL